MGTRMDRVSARVIMATLMGTSTASQGRAMSTPLSGDGPLRLLRLLQLVSPSLPVGAFAYSQGLEWAVEVGWVKDESSLEGWLSDQLLQALARVDLPVLMRMMSAAAAEDPQSMSSWIGELEALRETAELRAEEAGRGRALSDLLGLLGMFDAGSGPKAGETLLVASAGVPQLPSAASPARACDPSARWRELLSRSQLAGFAFAATAWRLEPSDTLLGYGWSWAENLTLAGVKLVPLGQTAGQRILLRLAEQIPEAIAEASSLADEEIGASVPAFAIASSQHEIQYTRLFRS
jgi:urease accessory protein